MIPILVGMGGIIAFGKKYLGTKNYNLFVKGTIYAGALLIGYMIYKAYQFKEEISAPVEEVKEKITATYTWALDEIEETKDAGKQNVIENLKVMGVTNEEALDVGSSVKIDYDMYQRYADEEIAKSQATTEKLIKDIKNTPKWLWDTFTKNRW